jgi:hypothetical protein
MHKDIKDNTCANKFSITGYMATLEGRLEAHANCIVTLPDLGADYYRNKLMEVVESLNAVREKLHDSRVWSVDVK